MICKMNIVQSKQFLNKHIDHELIIISTNIGERKNIFLNFCFEQK